VTEHATLVPPDEGCVGPAEPVTGLDDDEDEDAEVFRA